MSHRPSPFGDKAIRITKLPHFGWTVVDGWRDREQRHWKKVTAHANIPIRKPGEPYQGRRQGGVYTSADAYTPGDEENP